MDLLVRLNGGGFLMGKFIDLSGQKFGHLLVIRYDKQKRKWLCKCDCEENKYYYARRDWLVEGRVVSCGCHNKKKGTKDLTGQRFGRLTVLNPTDKRTPNRRIVWHCHCDCGNDIDVSSDHLIQGHTKSCGCLSSHGEMIIAAILRSLKITFKQQYIFKNCVNPKNNTKLRFDFYLPEYNCCIEYDGEQHFSYTGKDWNTKEHYEATKYRDNIKNKYCQDNNIIMIRIPYTELNNLNEEYIKSRLESL